MSKPVYLLIVARGYTEAWYSLSEEEQKHLWAEVAKVDERAGAKWILRCDSRWADEANLGWGVIEYPDMEVYQRKVEELEKLQWWRYFSAQTTLGTKAVE